MGIAELINKEKKTWMPQWSFIKRGSIKEYFAKM